MFKAELKVEGGIAYKASIRIPSPNQIRIRIRILHYPIGSEIQNTAAALQDVKKNEILFQEKV